MNPDNTRPAADRPVYNDEIDLIELCAKIWRGKWKVVIASALSLILAIAYLMITPKLYKLETTLAPPLAADLEPIQPPASGGRYALPPIQSDSIFALLKGYLESEEKQFSFWSMFHGLDSASSINDTDRQAFLIFRAMLNVSFGKKDDPAVSVSLQTDNPDGDIKLLADYIHYTNRQVIDGLVSRMEQVFSIQKGKLEEDIERSRTQYKTQLQDEVAKLEEALAIAVQIGIEETPYKQLANVEVKVVDNRFLLGTKTLNSQLEALKARKGKDSFVPGLRSLQNQLQQVDADLATLKKHQDEARAFLTLKPLVRPQRAEKPKKALVLALSVVIGGFLGLCWIFVAGLAAAIRQRDIVSAAEPVV